MPYIEPEQRKYVNSYGYEPCNITDAGDWVKSPGELNYLITRIINSYLGSTKKYEKYNEVIGVLECAKLEFYRRAVSPYEDQKISQNGDVY